MSYLDEVLSSNIYYGLYFCDFLFFSLGLLHIFSSHIVKISVEVVCRQGDFLQGELGVLAPVCIQNEYTGCIPAGPMLFPKIWKKNNILNM